MLDETESKTVDKAEEGDQQRKKKWDTEWSKPVENMNKNLQSFLEIIPVQKGVLLSHKLWDYVYEY